METRGGSIVINVRAVRPDLVRTVTDSLRLFYPDLEIDVGQDDVRLSSSSMPTKQSAAAWTAQLHVARFAYQHRAQRDRLMSELFE